jgi:hypothetical protein
MGRLSDLRVTQYWDKNHLFADQPSHTTANHEGTQWDEVAVYPQGAQWNEQLPRAAFLNGPVVRSLDSSKVVTDLLSR